MTPSELKILLDCIPNYKLTDDFYNLIIGYIIYNINNISYDDGYKLWIKYNIRRKGIVVKLQNCDDDTITTFNVSKNYDDIVNESIGYCYKTWPYINEYILNFYSKSYIDTLSIIELEKQCKCFNPKKYETYYKYGKKISIIYKWVLNNINRKTPFKQIYNGIQQSNLSMTKKTIIAILKELYPNDILNKNNKLYLIINKMKQNKPEVKNIYMQYQHIVDDIFKKTNRTIFVVESILCMYEEYCGKNLIPKNIPLFKKFIIDNYSQYNLRSKNIIRI